MPNNDSLSHPRHAGAPLGNSNAFKHGFYTRRIKKRDLSGVETTDLKSLVDEIALIRVFTRRLVESCNPTADLYELAGILRILCLASTTITRILRVHYILTGSENDIDRDIEEAIRQVHAELTAKHASSPHPESAKNPGDVPSSNQLSSGED
jgi:hypothetical protein